MIAQYCCISDKREYDGIHCTYTQRQNKHTTFRIVFFRNRLFQQYSMFSCFANTHICMHMQHAVCYVNCWNSLCMMLLNFYLRSIAWLLFIIYCSNKRFIMTARYILQQKDKIKFYIILRMSIKITKSKFKKNQRRVLMLKPRQKCWHQIDNRII